MRHYLLNHTFPFPFQLSTLLSFITHYAFSTTPVAWVFENSAFFVTLHVAAPMIR